MHTFTIVFFSRVVCSEGGVYLILAGKQTKKEREVCWVFFPDLFGHSRSKIVYCAAPILCVAFWV